MFTKQQLELLEDILDGKVLCGSLDEAVCQADPRQLKDIQAAVKSALWVSTRELDRKDRAAVKDADAAGKVTRIEGWTMASRLAAEREAQPKHDAANAKGGLALLAALGLKKEPSA